MCCVVPILFGWFLRVTSLCLFSFGKLFCDLHVEYCMYCLCLTEITETGSEIMLRYCTLHKSFDAGREGAISRHCWNIQINGRCGTTAALFPCYMTWFLSQHQSDGACEIHCRKRSSNLWSRLSRKLGQLRFWALLCQSRPVSRL